MGTYTLACINGASETKLKLSEQIVGIEWECLGGEAVWGNPYKGRSLGGILADGSVQLSLFNTLSGVTQLKPGATGDRWRGADSGGTFPDGDFSWTVV